MRNLVVHLKIRARLPHGSRPYLDPVFSENNKLKPLYAQFAGKPVQFPDGVYHLHYLKRGRRSSDPQRAKTEAGEALEAQAAGLKLAEDPAVPAPNLREAVNEFLEEIKAHKLIPSHLIYLFLEFIAWQSLGLTGSALIQFVSAAGLCI